MFVYPSIVDGSHMGAEFISSIQIVTLALDFNPLLSTACDKYEF